MSRCTVHTYETVDSRQDSVSAWADFAALVAARHCKRAYLDRPVSREHLADVLDVAGQAPSTRNGQPWQVAVVTGEARRALSRRLCEEFDRGVEPNLDYPNRPGMVDPETAQRAEAAGAGVLRAIGVARTDTAARRGHLRNNMDFYGAPAAMIFHLPMPAVAGSFLEMGLFLQNVMLGLVARGLGSCPQSSVAGYPDVLRRHLRLGRHRLVVCGLAVGYPDPSAPVNAFVPDRIAPARRIRWWDHALPSDAVDSAP